MAAPLAIVPPKHAARTEWRALRWVLRRELGFAILLSALTPGLSLEERVPAVPARGDTRPTIKKNAGRLMMIFDSLKKRR